MDDATVEILTALNTDFYRRNAASFSQTRRAGWPGWDRCLVFAGQCGAFAPFDAKMPTRGLEEGCSLFDLACGNLRFENYLVDTFPRANFSFHAIDNCGDLVCPEGSGLPLRYQELDVMGALLRDPDLASVIEAPRCDMAVSFGFMHHVPSKRYREAVLRALVEQTRVGGCVVVSFWRFLRSDQLARKAALTHEQALRERSLPALEAGDYLLGWKNILGEYRYCHHFTDVEIDDLVASVSPAVREIARFSCDGRTADLNTYVVLEVLESPSGKSR